MTGTPTPHTVLGVYATLWGDAVSAVRDVAYARCAGCRLCVATGVAVRRDSLRALLLCTSSALWLRDAFQTCVALTVSVRLSGPATLLIDL